MSNKPPRIIYLQDKNDDGEYGGNVAGAEVTWCANRINANDSVYINRQELGKLRPRLFVMKYLPDDTIDWRSLGMMPKTCIANFERDFGRSWQEARTAGWRCLPVGIVELED